MAQEKVAYTGNFFRYYYDSIILFLIIAILSLIIMVVVVLQQIHNRPLPQFHAISTDNKKIALSAFDAPNLLPDTLIKWARKATVLAYTFDFVNYDKQFDVMRPYFTQAGWDSYQNSVSNLISTIKQNQLFVNGVVTGHPVISNQGELPGSGYVWRIQLPFLVTYQSAETSSRQTYYVSLAIVRVPTRVDPTGIGIDQFVMNGS